MKKIIRLNERQLIRIIKRVVREQEETMPTTNTSTNQPTLSDLQKIASEEGVTGDVSKFVNKENPACAPPLTGDSEKDNYLKQFFSWAKKQSPQKLRASLRDIRQKLKAAKLAKKQGQLQEQAAAIVIGTMSISASVLIAIGAFLIIIILIVIIAKTKKKGGSCNPGWWDNL